MERNGEKGITGGKTVEGETVRAVWPRNPTGRAKRYFACRYADRPFDNQSRHVRILTEK